MAQKQGGSKRPRKRPGAAAARSRATQAKAKRVAAQKAREAANKNRLADNTPWAIAKAARAERRKGMKPKERTALGNIIEVGKDGIKRVRPGSKREIETALHFRQEEAKREAAARYETKKKKAPKKEKAA